MATKIVFLLQMVIFMAFSSQAQNVTTNAPAVDETIPADYQLGPGDALSIWVRDAPEITEKQFRIDAMGFINLPMVGRIHAGGLTIQQLEAELTGALTTYIREPQVTINPTALHVETVSVLGGVRNPGTHPFRGMKNLLEIISAAGGLATDAGGVIRITRRKVCGPLTGATIIEDTPETVMGELDISKVLESNPEQNIPICADDVIFVPKMSMVYVIGDVVRQGGFSITDKNSMSVLHLLSLAGGATGSANLEATKILRPVMGGPKQAELPLDLKRIMAGKAPDVFLRSNDILFIPGSSSKGTAMRALNGAINRGSSMVAWGAMRAIFF
jgi:polysaccharide export outer membrane protein